MMSPIGEMYLWKILTKSGRKNHSYQDVFLDLRNEILKIDLPRVIESESSVGDIYISKEVINHKVARFGESYQIDKKKKLGSQFIQGLKKDHSEPDYYLTYEHLLAELLSTTPESAILVGAQGSGKSSKLKTVWHKYLKNQKHLSSPLFENKGKIRILVDVLNEGFKNPNELLQYLYVTIFVTLQMELRNTFDENYRMFSIELLEKFSKGKNISYIHTLIFHGLSFDNVIPYKEYLEKIVLYNENDLMRLVTFAFCFCGWLNKKYCPDKNNCIIFIFDNIDETPQKIQEMVIFILGKKEIDLPMLCACRPETLRNWKNTAIPMLIIPHIGPTSYEVVIRRFEHYLKNFDMSDLKNSLKGISDEEDFIENLKLILNHLKTMHFENFFQNLFGWQIRQALRFTQGIVDVAANRTHEALQNSIAGRSLLALERIIYRPWGMQSPKLFVVNALQQGQSKKYRLSGLRVIKFLSNYEEYKHDIKAIYNHLHMYGYTKQNTVDVLQEMINSRLVITATKEYLELEKYDSCKNEYIRLTETGLGLWQHCFNIGYLESIMYYCLCSAKEYPNDLPDKPELIGSLKILRYFLKETAEIEFAELDQVHMKGCQQEYHFFYNNKTIHMELLGSVIATVFDIWKSQKMHSSHSKKINHANTILEIAMNFINDYFWVIERISKEYSFEPLIEEYINKKIEIMMMEKSRNHS